MNWFNVSDVNVMWHFSSNAISVVVKPKCLAAASSCHAVSSFCVIWQTFHSISFHFIPFLHLFLAVSVHLYFLILPVVAAPSLRCWRFPLQQPFLHRENINKPLMVGLVVSKSVDKSWAASSDNPSKHSANNVRISYFFFFVFVSLFSIISSKSYSHFNYLLYCRLSRFSSRPFLI